MDKVKFEDFQCKSYYDAQGTVATDYAGCGKIPNPGDKIYLHTAVLFVQKVTNTDVKPVLQKMGAITMDVWTWRTTKLHWHLSLILRNWFQSI